MRTTFAAFSGIEMLSVSQSLYIGMLIILGVFKRCRIVSGALLLTLTRRLVLLEQSKYRDKTQYF